MVSSGTCCIGSTELLIGSLVCVSGSEAGAASGAGNFAVLDILRRDRIGISLGLSLVDGGMLLETEFRWFLKVSGS